MGMPARESKICPQVFPFASKAHFDIHSRNLSQVQHKLKVCAKNIAFDRTQYKSFHKQRMIQKSSKKKRKSEQEKICAAGFDYSLLFELSSIDDTSV